MWMRTMVGAGAVGAYAWRIEDPKASYAAFYDAADWLTNWLVAGEGVLVHCMAGLGRAGTIAAAMLIEGGMPAPDAMQLVRWVRPGAIQSVAQEELLEALAGLR